MLQQLRCYVTSSPACRRLYHHLQWAGVILLGAGLPLGAAYFQITYSNIEEEARRLHREGDLFRSDLLAQRNKHTATAGEEK